MKVNFLTKFASKSKLLTKTKSAFGKAKSLFHSNTSEILEQQRREARVFVDNISEEKWNKMSSEIFVKQGETSETACQQYLRQIREIISEAGIEIPENVNKSLTTLEHKTKLFAERMEVAKSKGKNFNNFNNLGHKFREKNAENIDIVENYLSKLRDDLINKHATITENNEEANKLFKTAYSLMKLRSPFGCTLTEDLMNIKIGELAEGIIKEDQIFYHGTTSARKIMKNGFHLKPKNRQAKVSSRELGQGVYTTPDRQVAGSFARITGGILPLKINLSKVAVVNNAQQEEISRVICKNLGFSADTSSKIELIINELFKRNGFNAAYTAESLGKESIFGNINAKLVDAITGGKQSQLVVFDTKDITILPKTLKERVQNQILQIKSIIKAPYMTIKMLRNEHKKIC